MKKRHVKTTPQDEAMAKAIKMGIDVTIDAITRTVTIGSDQPRSFHEAPKTTRNLRDMDGHPGLFGEQEVSGTDARVTRLADSMPSRKEMGLGMGSTRKSRYHKPRRRRGYGESKESVVAMKEYELLRSLLADKEIDNYTFHPETGQVTISISMSRKKAEEMLQKGVSLPKGVLKLKGSTTSDATIFFSQSK